MAKIEYATLNLPKSLVEEMKIWRMAFCAAYGRSMSYAQIIRGMLDSIEYSDPAVHDELCNLVEKHPEMIERLGNYTSSANQN